LVLRKAKFDRQVAALRVAVFAQALPNCSYLVSPLFERLANEKPDHRHRWLLRPRHHRPLGRAAEERYERAALHSITSSARPSSVSGKVMPSALAVLKLMNSSTFVTCCTGR
jgi:hypothetical protein